MVSLGALPSSLLVLASDANTNLHPPVRSRSSGGDDGLSTGAPDAMGSYLVGLGQVSMPTSGRMGSHPAGESVIDIWYPVEPGNKGTPATYVVDASSVARSPPPPIASLLETDASLASLIEEGTCSTDLLVPLTPRRKVLQGLSFDFKPDSPAFQDHGPASAASGQHPLVVYSHGSGGNPFDHIDLMKRLASHGFVIAAVTHAGDALVDHVLGSSGGSLDSSEHVMCNRAKDVRDVITYMTTKLGSDAAHWPQAFPVEIDPSKIAVAGVSAGGFAALSSVLGYGAATQEGTCDFEDGTSVALPDERVSAAIAMAPHTKDLFKDAEVAALSSPVLVLDGEGDAATPPSENIASLFPRFKCTENESVLVQLTNGGHPSFQDLCHDSDLVQGVTAESPQVDPTACTVVLPALSSYYYSLIGSYAAVGCPDDAFVDPFTGIVFEAGAAGHDGAVTPIDAAHDVTGSYAVSYLKYKLSGEEAYAAYLGSDFGRTATSGVADEIDGETSVFLDDDVKDVEGCSDDHRHGSSSAAPRLRDRKSVV